MVLTRRTFLGFSGSLSLMAQPRQSTLKVVVAGGHPGDPECGCGGTIAKYTNLGHAVTLLYLNRGEGFCGASDLSHCAAIRTAEGLKACEVLKAHSVFAGQVDGQAVIDASHYAAFARLLAAINPDVVFTQWPLDRHRDHRAVSALTLDAWLSVGQKFALYYYEVAEDTMAFSPGEYVDISSVESLRRDACYAHASQRPEKWYPKQVELTTSRGRDSGVRQAEAFLRHRESRPALLP